MYIVTRVARQRTAALTLAVVATLASACGGGFDRQAVIEEQVDIGMTQPQAECYADALEAQFGEDPAADGELSDADVDALLSIRSDCFDAGE